MKARQRQILPAAWSVLSAAWLIGLFGAVQVTAGQDVLTSTAAVAVVVACAVCAVALSVPTTAHLARIPLEPAFDRLHGRFSQLSRPGVPGRVRARAPGR